MSFGVEIDNRGLAIVGNVIEHSGGTTGPVLFINADSNHEPAQNVILQHNTVVGTRTNLMYLDESVNVAKSTYAAFNVWQQVNTKSDVFSSRSANIGNWPVRYKVGWAHNAALQGSNNGTGYGPTEWLGEISALGEVPSCDPDWTDDASFAGTSAGGGDYTPGANSDLPVVPVGKAAYPVDLLGRGLADGDARSGAVQRP